MIVEGSQEISASPQQVWEFVTDPSNVATCLPDVQSSQVIDGNTLRAKMKFGIDFAKGMFDGTFRFSQISPPTKLKIDGDAKGLGSAVKIAIELTLEGGEKETTLNWKVDVLISGLLKPAINEGNLKSLADHLAGEMFECLSSKMTV
jgi:carbon monoxide dehydrogenase subunit G